MKKVLLDTNILIYREDHCVINEEVAKLTRILYDSDKCKLLIHPLSIEDINNMRNSKKKAVILSKINVYKKIVEPPIASAEFHNLVGKNKIPNDIIDNNLLFAVYRNCVDYLITNDKKLKRKSNLINLSSRVLTINEAINLLKPLEKKEISIPVFIKKEFLYNIDINDKFFDTLKKDYKGFKEWYKRKSLNEKQAYISRYNNKIGSFLMLKLEDENEKYLDFKKPFSKKKRLKISTFKVANTGNKIGETFIKIIVNEAILEKVEEIYITVFDKQSALINLLKEYGFNIYTKKETMKSNGKIELENVMVRNLKDDNYPNVNTFNKRFFIVPIKQKFHEKLFPESEKQLQISFSDLYGLNTYSNGIKKAYICNSNIKKILSKDILIFYSSEEKKGITSIGVVDFVFDDFKNVIDLYKMANRRTVYNLSELERMFKSSTKLLMFKHHKSLKNHVSYKFLNENGILKRAPQSITEITLEQYKKIIAQGN